MSPDLCRQFRELLPTLRPPKNYYRASAGGAGRALPQEVITFSRSTARSLGTTGSRTSHHRYVLIFAVEGEGTVCINARNFRLQPGTCVVVQPYQYHGYTDAAADLLWLFITFEDDEGGGGWSELGDAVHRLGELEIRLCLEIAGCWQERRRLPLMAWHLGLLLERIGYLPGGRRREPEPEADLLVKVNRYALARLQSVVGIQELAANIGLSESHLRSEFRRLTGKSLGAHLRHLRLQHACALLHTTEEPVGRIAEECGFESVFSFSRAFKTVLGLSPRDYRNREHF